MKALIIFILCLHCVLAEDEDLDTPVVEGEGDTHEKNVLNKTNKINGTNTVVFLVENEQFPFYVRMEIIQLTNNNYKYTFCGGALLNEHFILTAASCVCFAPIHLIKMYTNSLTMINDNQGTYQSEIIICHESFDLTKYENDIALIPVNTSILQSENVNYIYPYASPIQDGLNLTHMGYFFTNESPKSLMYSNAEVLNPATCPYEYNEEQSLCVFNKVNRCYANFGSPYVIVNDTNTFLVGIASHRNDNCTDNGVTFITNVQYYIPWIQSKIH